MFQNKHTVHTWKMGHLRHEHTDNGRYDRLAWPEHQCEGMRVYQRGEAGGGEAVLYLGGAIDLRCFVGPP